VIDVQNWQASCDDGWTSKIVQAMTLDDAANLVTDELVAHVKLIHNTDMPNDPAELHKSVVEHTKAIK